MKVPWSVLDGFAESLHRARALRYETDTLDVGVDARSDGSYLADMRVVLSRWSLVLLSLGLSASTLACDKQADRDLGARPAHEQAGGQPLKRKPTPAGGKDVMTRPKQKKPRVLARARIGDAAPAFTLKDLGGKPVSLSDFRGKTVVLEWFNPGCPYVRAAHLRGPLKGLADKYLPGGDVVWLAVNSGGEGRQGHGLEANKAGVERFGLRYPVLQDEAGQVGKAYGATNTPHIFIIDKEGVLVYQGAPDNSPDGEGESPQGGPLVNYVVQALGEIAAGKLVSVKSTSAYGCSVKYAR